MPHMARMIPFAGQILDQVRDPGQRPQVGLIAALDRSCEQRGANRLQLYRREAGLPAGGPAAPQALGALGLPDLVPAMGRLAPDTQPAGYLRWIDSLFEEFRGLKASLFHCRVIALLPHDAISLQMSPAPVSLLYEFQ